jgi:hypothetical protein
MSLQDIATRHIAMTNMAAASSFLADPWPDHARTKKKHLLRLTNP